MNAVEFTTELGPDRVLVIPQSAAKRRGAYNQFLADDDSHGDIYESCR